MGVSHARSWGAGCPRPPCGSSLTADRTATRWGQARRGGRRCRDGKTWREHRRGRTPFLRGRAPTPHPVRPAEVPSPPVRKAGGRRAARGKRMPGAQGRGPQLPEKNQPGKASGGGTGQHGELSPLIPAPGPLYLLFPRMPLPSPNCSRAPSPLSFPTHSLHCWPCSRLQTAPDSALDSPSSRPGPTQKHQAKPRPPALPQASPLKSRQGNPTAGFHLLRTCCPAPPPYPGGMSLGPRAHGKDPSLVSGLGSPGLWEGTLPHVAAELPRGWPPC